MKTGEVLDRDEEGLWLCESWEEDGVVHTTRTLVEGVEPETISQVGLYEPVNFTRTK